MDDEERLREVENAVVRISAVLGATRWILSIGLMAVIGGAVSVATIALQTQTRVDYLEKALSVCSCAP